MDKRYFKIEHLIHLYNHTEVLNIPSLSFDKGKIYALVGPNGAGKTTLMLILSLLFKPTSGRVIYRGNEIMMENSKDMRGRITMLFQDAVLFNTTVQDNVEYGLKIKKKKSGERKKKAEECLDMVGLKGFAERRARELSSGEAQRVAIARALAIRPEIFLLDEPTANVDELNTKILEEIIQTLSKDQETTIIFSTHNHNQAFRLADEIITLMEGKVVPFTPENIFRGKSLRDGEDTWFDTGKIKVFIPSKGEAKAIYIDPRDILVSLTPLSSSARNCFEGNIEGVRANGDSVRLLVDAGEHLRVLITKKSFFELGLNIGMRVYLTFKSSAVQVF
ncbi:MAG: ATP-binding cassette domain-containing protein [Proteobacteria bacterium]|nr:ATP-binding cassette domain-containing protein [Pseudomonadota bacterium]